MIKKTIEVHSQVPPSKGERDRQLKLNKDEPIGTKMTNYKTEGQRDSNTERQNDRKYVSWGMIGKDERYYQWRFKNELEQILSPTLSISDVQTSNRYNTTIGISIYIHL